MIYTTNRRVWEWDEQFRERLRLLSAIGIDMETATVFIVGHVNQIPRGALLLVSDAPMTPEGIKTQESDKAVTARYTDLHLDIGHPRHDRDRSARRGNQALWLLRSHGSIHRQDGNDCG